MKKKIMTFLVMLTVFLGMGQMENTHAAIRECKPQLSKCKVVMNVGKTKKLKVKKVQEGAKIKWKSNNSEVVKVTKKGKLIAKKNGTAIIKVTVKQTVTKTILKCKVTVKE